MRVALGGWVGWILYNPSYTPWYTALSGKSSAPSVQRYPFFWIVPVEFRGTAGSTVPPRAKPPQARK
jgi:hypothetical protein